MKSLYRILGVSRHDGDAQIKSAYRRLVKQLHPDLHPGDAAIAERFKEVSRAYAILSDAIERGRYDRGEIDGNGARRRPFRRGPARTSVHPGGTGFEPFHQAPRTGAEVFQYFFSARKGEVKTASIAAQRDHIYEITVSFFEAARGISRRLSLHNGKTVDVIVPPGTSSGRSLRLRGQGEPAVAGGHAGDAIIAVQVAPHEFLTKRGNDVHLDLAVSANDARNGGRIRVPTLDGAVTMTLPKGSRLGTILRLKGKGIEASRGSGRGDQFVSIKIDAAAAAIDLDDAIANR